MYNYLFYKIYVFFRGVGNKSPEFASIILLSIINFMNFMTLLAYYFVSNNFSLDRVQRIFDTNILLAFMILNLIVHAAYYMRRNRDKKIYEKFNKHPRHYHIIGSIGVFFFVAISIFVCYKFTIPSLVKLR